VEFEFAAGGNRYRVIRKRVKAGLRRAGQPVLELQVATPLGFNSLTGNSVQETQQRIVEILRMDYDTFINSALLLQNRANEFTIKPPGERKKVLADILDLSLYDKLEARAKERAKRRETECHELESRIREIDDELAKKESYQSELHEVRVALSEIEAQVRGEEEVLEKLRQAKRNLELKKEQSSELEKRIAQAKEELNYLESQLTQHQRKVKEYEALLAQSRIIEEGYQGLIATTRENEELNHKLMQKAAMTERRRQLEQAIEKAKGELLAEQSVLQSQSQRLKTESEAAPRLERELLDIEVKLSQIGELERELEQKRGQWQELSNRVHHLKSINTKLEEEIAELNSKLELLSRGGARCPLCETELGVEGRDRIRAKYEQDKQIKTKAYHANELEVRQRESEFQALSGELAQLEAKINKERAAAQGEELSLKKELSRAQEAAIELAQAERLLTQVRGRLDKGDFASEEQAALKELLHRIESLGYDEERHRAVKVRLAEFSEYEGLKHRLDEAESAIEQERASLARTEEGVSRWRFAYDTELERQRTLAKELEALPQLLARLSEEERNYDALLSRQARGRQILGAVQQKLERCAELEKSKEEKSQALTTAAYEKGIYEELSEAFGRKGVQALIIEQVLPELEEEANKLLSRMTDNRMSLRLESQRQSKKGEVIETLEIKVWDELGTRSYEMFSGGEAFRIDFALRIALSKLLARRAGAPLPTIFIDEGFGTQDSSGREKLVEAINSIQDDFEKIIAITHIDELKDAFPVHIEVTKTAEGSMIEVS
jgi:exonuclease SbcC